MPSPQFNRIVLIADAPHNVAPYLLPRGRRTALPGLRLESFQGRHTYLARHLPTGAQLVVTGNASGTWGGARRSAPRRFRTTDDCLTAQEHAELDLVPEISDAAARLLAGLICRITAKDPHGDWAVGWFVDPLDRDGWNCSDEVPFEKKLSGSQDLWTLRWNGLPYADDVATALTHDPIGIPGAVVHDTGDQVEVRLGPAVLRLSARRDPIRRSMGAAL
ncbi:hypothetical protein [Streptomyces clavuligerus]|uniref:hypothetical protein n=1 Tax=Streptomyces clavuligerus TaxID=1901 RepID=UPI00020D93E4|nr:hypothetical protein [Streptomyces clavuligerus]WDN51588.1 hypothetical protein LL058_06820 [Streptomyces clavuligerus]